LQAVSFLVIHQKHNKSLEEITTDLCPVLSVQQLYRISTMYWDDRYGTETVSHDVLARMKQLMVENNSAASHSFLLDDDSSIPFSLDDIQNQMEDKVPHLLYPTPPPLSISPLSLAFQYGGGGGVYQLCCVTTPPPIPIFLGDWLPSWLETMLCYLATL